MTVFLDLDEVLADFTGGALAVHGWTRERLLEVGLGQGYGMHRYMDLSLHKFWRKIGRRGPLFWERLEVLPWAEEVVKQVEAVTDDWYIATSPSFATSSYSGKIRWMKRFFGPKFSRFIITPYKTLLAREGILLIDDNEETVKKFFDNRAATILFPSWHNSFHSIHLDPVPHLTANLEHYKCM